MPPWRGGRAELRRRRAHRVLDIAGGGLSHKDGRRWLCLHRASLPPAGTRRRPSPLARGADRRPGKRWEGGAPREVGYGWPRPPRDPRDKTPRALSPTRGARLLVFFLVDFSLSSKGSLYH
eukprot:scaffold241977_cov28-Tisochrysis_lutea.AAC.2